MIQNLNGVTFHNYGHILTKSLFNTVAASYKKKWNIKEHSSFCSKLTEMFQINQSPTLIEMISGIGLLCVSSVADPSKIQVFLLDKPISINPRLFFNIVPLYGNCRVSIAYLDNCKEEKIILSQEMIPSVIYSKFSLEKIHTLFYQEKEKGFHFKGEKHHFWELTYVDKGILKTVVEGEMYSLNQGDFILYGPNQYHTQWADADVSVCFVTITFDMEFEESSMLVDCVFHGDSEIKNLLYEILKEKKINNYYTDDLILCYVKQLIIKLVRNLQLENKIHKLPTDMQSNVENAIVSQALDFIHKNIHLKLSVSDIADTIPISSSYLSLLFKKTTGSTLIEYVSQFRLEKSKEYLRTSSYTVSEIAALLGYSSVHYFSKQFKDYYGISPTVYAKSIH